MEQRSVMVVAGPRNQILPRHAAQHWRWRFGAYRLRRPWRHPAGLRYGCCHRPRWGENTK